MFRVKITILKCTYQEELVEKYAKGGKSFPVCDVFKPGEIYYCDRVDTPPEGFCGYAWADLHRDIMTLLAGGDFFWMEKPGTEVACCTDGLRTVYFLMEREVGSAADGYKELEEKGCSGDK